MSAHTHTPYYVATAGATICEDCGDVICTNPHGSDGAIECWSPGGPCPIGQTVCECCGPCAQCRPGAHPLLTTPEAGESS